MGSRLRSLALVALLLGVAAPAAAVPVPLPQQAASAPTPDPRVGLRAGLQDAGEATWNLRVLSRTPTPAAFLDGVNSDLAFTGNYAIQGNFGGFQVWDLANPAQPALVNAYVCPASQSDVSVYRNLLFVSGEDFAARLDCGTEGVKDPTSTERLRGIRIFDITDIRQPKQVGVVQTCRGSHTHSLLIDPKDAQNVYVYVSGSAPVRPGDEMPGCSAKQPGEDPGSALFRIEVIKVPLAHPEQAAIVSSPRIFTGLFEPPQHGDAPDDLAALDAARKAGKFVFPVHGEMYILGDRFIVPYLDSMVVRRGGTGTPTGADSTALRAALPAIIAGLLGEPLEPVPGPRPGPTQCHDITTYPAIGLAGGACEGYGFLIDIKNPADPRRLVAAADSNFSYWHSATFNNDGTKVLFTDEWGGGGAPKCRATDPKEWGADAIFDIVNGALKFRGYYKLPAAQTPLENCVAHNGSLIPIPGRDVMVQSWYQGGISVFDWTDPIHPREIAFFDRGPVSAEGMVMGGSWSAYWYNGVIVSSEIARGLDIMELEPSPLVTKNEIDAAKSVRFDQFNAQSQQRFVWPPSFALARAYLDQLERSNGLAADRIASARESLASAEAAAGTQRRQALIRLIAQMGPGTDAAKVRLLVATVQALAGTP